MSVSTTQELFSQKPPRQDEGGKLQHYSGPLYGLLRSLAEENSCSPICYAQAAAAAAAAGLSYPRAVPKHARRDWRVARTVSNAPPRDYERQRGGAGLGGEGMGKIQTLAPS